MNEIKFKDSFFDNPKSLEKLAEPFWHSERLKYKASCSAIIFSRWGQSTISVTLELHSPTILFLIISGIYVYNVVECSEL